MATGARTARLDLVIAGGFAVLALATRGWFRGHGLYSWDSGLLAAGIRDFDFAAGHPHPPYYPLVIAAGKALSPVLGPAEALVALAVVSSGILVAMTYLVARFWLGRAWSGFAASIVLLSPTALFNGSVALSYVEEGATSAIVAWAAWRCRVSPTPLRASAMAVALSVAIGIRPSSLFLLAPLAVWALWPCRNARTWAAGIGAGAAATAAWVVPALWAGGGLRWFLLGNRYQSEHIVFAHTVFQDGWAVVPVNAARLASYVPWEMTFLVAVAVAFVVSAMAALRHMPPAPASSFLATWAFPSLAFFLFVYAGWPIFPSGYVMVLMPVAAIGAATALRAVASGVQTSGAPDLARACAAILLAAIAIAPAAWVASWPEAMEPSREADAWSRSWWALERDYPANETALVAFYGWFWCRVDHPEYLAWGVIPFWRDDLTYVLVVEGQGDQEDHGLYEIAIEGSPGPHPIPPWVRQIVLVHGPPSRGEGAMFKDSAPASDLVLESGMHVTVLDPTGYETIEQALRWFDDSGGPLA